MKSGPANLTAAYGLPPCGRKYASSPGKSSLFLLINRVKFSHYLTRGYRKVLGIDAEGPSIRSAMHNKKTNPGSSETRFMAQRIKERPGRRRYRRPLQTAPEKSASYPLRGRSNSGRCQPMTKRWLQSTAHRPLEHVPGLSQP